MITQKEDFVLLDIRFGRLAREYYIPYNRKNIPLDMLIDRYRQVNNTRKKVVVVGEIGKRASIAANYLRMKGVDTVYRLDGGMQLWLKERFPVKKR